VIVGAFAGVLRPRRQAGPLRSLRTTAGLRDQGGIDNRFALIRPPAGLPHHRMKVRLISPAVRGTNQRRDRARPRGPKQSSRRPRRRMPSTPNCGPRGRGYSLAAPRPPRTAKVVRVRDGEVVTTSRLPRRTITLVAFWVLPAAGAWMPRWAGLAGHSELVERRSRSVHVKRNPAGGARTWPLPSSSRSGPGRRPSTGSTAGSAEMSRSRRGCTRRVSHTSTSIFGAVSSRSSGPKLAGQSMLVLHDGTSREADVLDGWALRLWRSLRAMSQTD
jgi:hypothetical protein